LALWVCGLTGLVAIPVAFVLIRRAEMSKAVASTQQPKVAGTPQPKVAAAAAGD
jgi:hypothetical protein